MDNSFNTEVGGISRKRVVKKSPVKFIVAGVIALVVIVVAVLITGFVTGAFLSAPDKILKATANTFEETSALLEDLDYSEIVGKDKYTLSLDMSADTEAFEVNYMNTKSKKAFTGNIRTTAGITGDFNFVLDDEELRISFPFINNRTVFTYNYTQKNDGYLIQMLQENGVSAEDINKLLKDLYKGTASKTEEGTDTSTIKDFREREFTKAAQKNCEIDGEQVTCNGYETIIANGEIISFVTEMEKAATNDDLRDMCKQWKTDAKKLGDVKVRFYLHKNQLAAIEAESNGSVMELLFLGGERRTQNMAFLVDGKEVLSVSGTVADGVETTTIYLEKQELAKISYKPESGDFDLTVKLEPLDVDIEGRECNIVGIITSDEEKLMVDISGMGIDREYTALMAGFTIRSGASIEDPKGDELDLGKANQTQIMQFFD